MQLQNLATLPLAKHIGVVVLLAFGLVVGVFGWAMTTELSSAVIASGRVVVEGNAKKIQHLVGGIVSEIDVKEGDRVDADQVLVRLNGTIVQANLSIAENTLAQLYARRARLQAEASRATQLTVPENLSELTTSKSATTLVASEQNLFISRKNALEGMRRQMATRKQQLADEVDGLTVQINAVRDQVGLVDQDLEKVNALFKRGLTTQQRLNDYKRRKSELEGQMGQSIAARAQTEGRIGELDLQLLQLDEDRQSEVSKDLTSVEASIAEYEERLAATKDQLARLEIRAPIAGRIYELSVHNMNAVVQPGEVLMLVVPEHDALQVEATIAPKDIDQIYKGQPVDIRFTAFNQTTTPDISGEVSVISPDLQTDPRTGATFYTLRITPNMTTKKDLSEGSLYPGMPAEVFIKIADRTVMSYFSKPFADRLRLAFREE
ncbi:HlyD family type I secretion periplasmic adaptor subunit [Rhizobium binxianense]|uniref:HlyD family type I secretion periplasmic adaptor subunit n=1 Tax=Rhizobium binxianense TaxID=3024242 RepID=UPI00235F74A2|nr:HlyD family type I secretion periplasmic adaptor subunit [Rhizobium sp. MJ37]MDC9837279.1 HlyD family type I secretion periplasmic adaptor subunit [Rhizobium sp. MJ37]